MKLSTQQNRLPRQKKDTQANGVKVPKKKIPFRDRISFSKYISILLLVCLAIGFSVLSFFSLQTLLTHKSRDVLANYYYEFKHQGTNLAKLLTVQAFQNDISAKKLSLLKSLKQVKSDVILKVEKNTLAVVKGLPFESIKAKDLSTFPENKGSRFVVTTFRGKFYIAGRSKFPVSGGDEFIFMNSLEQSSLFKRVLKTKEDVSLYLTTRDGKVVYANDPNVTTASLESRNFVKKYIRSPLTEGQFKIGEGSDLIHSFFTSVPGTNLVLFGELPQKNIYNEISGIMANILMVSAVIILLVILIVNLSLSSVKRILHEMLAIVDSYRVGRFNVAVSAKSFGELQILRNAFVGLGRALMERDSKIIAFAEKEGMRKELEREMEVAQGIQENLISTYDPSDFPGIDCSTLYKPANKVAGDWFDLHYFKDERVFIAVIVDVAGHGAGSSLFTAIIASIFLNEKKLLLTDPDTFFQRINDNFLAFGKTKMHTTMQVVRFHLESDHVDVFSCGHTFPFMIKDPASSKMKVSAIQLPSDVLGLSDKFTFAHKKIEFQDEIMFYMYTDGITELYGDSGRMFGKKKLLKAIKSAPKTTCRQFDDFMQRTYEEYKGDHTQLDDMCSLTLKIKRPSQL